ncbi:MAG: tyrosine-type recombinase/integrase [Nodosilinea sp. WJT8-NPBG4]|nr:tyrosine-type recombinase/integrase [Nodosilinea sp. WJT8-NPBG4]
MTDKHTQSSFSAKLKVPSSGPPQKPKNEAVRSREYLTTDEVEALTQAAKKLGRHGHRDSTMIMLMYRHGLRVAEAIALRWDQVDLKQGILHVSRRKKGTPATHPLRGPELRALRQIQRQYPNAPYLFVSERKGPLTERSVHNIIQRAGQEAALPFPVHPHQLRHACGYYLASKGHDTRAIQAYLGHRNIQHTVKYTELSPNRFKDFWQD